MDQRVLKGLKDLYDLDIEYVEKIQHGHLNDNSKIVTPNGPVFLKQHRATNTKAIQYIEDVEVFFHANGIPVILPIQNKQGFSYFECADSVYTVYPYIDAVQIQRNVMNDDHISSISRFLAQIHRVTQNGTPAPLQTIGTERWDGQKSQDTLMRVQKMIMAKDKRTDFDDLALNVITQKLAFIKNNTLQYADFEFTNDTLLHGDYHNGNIFFDQNSVITAVFDFEKTCYAPRERELVRSMFLTCLAGSFSDDNFKGARTFLATYNHAYPIARDKVARALEVYIVRYGHSTWIEEEHYLKNNSRLDELYPRVLNNMLFFNKNNDVIYGELLSVLMH